MSNQYFSHRKHIQWSSYGSYTQTLSVLVCGNRSIDYIGTWQSIPYLYRNFEIDILFMLDIEIDKN